MANNAFDTFAFPDQASQGSLSPYSSALPNLNSITSQAEGSLGLSNPTPSTDNSNSGGLSAFGNYLQGLSDLLGQKQQQLLNQIPGAQTVTAIANWLTDPARIVVVIAGIIVLLAALFLLGGKKVLEIATKLPTA